MEVDCELKQACVKVNCTAFKAHLHHRSLAAILGRRTSPLGLKLSKLVVPSVPWRCPQGLITTLVESLQTRAVLSAGHGH